MDRTKFYNIATVNGINEIDHMWSTLSSFKLTYESSYYRLCEEDIGAPDLISKKLYGSEKYWWIILLVNKIHDPYNDMEIGDIIQVPSVFDVYNFVRQYKIR